jgi:hypothetical protein
VWLAGLPVGLKDIIDTADLPTEHGSAIFKGRRPYKDAACVTALRRSGGVVMAETVTNELATLTPSRTRNPVNLAHTPGGSSSGSAAAVAAGMVPAAVGTQTGGSVIRPAAYCGVYGFKPTFGMLPRFGVLTQSSRSTPPACSAARRGRGPCFADAAGLRRAHRQPGRPAARACSPPRRGPAPAAAGVRQDPRLWARPRPPRARPWRAHRGVGARDQLDHTTERACRRQDGAGRGDGRPLTARFGSRRS